VERHASEIDDALAAITVCDPAIGSGAFPVGMMTEIVRARLVLTPYLDAPKNRTAYEFKRHAIESSLYGVDIDPGAVEIAKLRLWLSLVVDEEEDRSIKPLPNLDFKIVVGDSLGAVEKNLFNSSLFSQLEELKPQFFNETNRRKKAQIREGIEALIHQLTSGRETFDFEIYFSEVFHARRGFDVVIANPPYVSVERFARTAQQAAWKKRFKTYASRGDIYCFFYERGLDLLRDRGVLTFISSNKFQRAGYGANLRKLLSRLRIRTLIDFCELPVFAASTDPMIVIVEKAPTDTSRTFAVLVVKDESEFTVLPESVARRGAQYKQEQLRDDGWSLEGGDGLALVEKMRAAGTPLLKYVDGRLLYGIKTGLNEAFVIDRTTRDRLVREDPRSADLIKPWIRGKDIKRWTHEYHDLYVIIVRFGFHGDLKKYPAILRHLKQYEDQLKARGQCKTSRGGGDVGQHHWLELDNNPSEDYIAAFDEPKIVFNETSRRLHAYLDSDGNAINKTGFIILTPDARFVLAVLNSTPMDWFYRATFPPWGDPWASGRIQFRGNRMAAAPIPSAGSAEKARLAKLAEAAERAADKGDSDRLAVIDQEIDSIVFSLFGFTVEEIEAVERALARTRSPIDADDPLEEGGEDS